MMLGLTGTKPLGGALAFYPVKVESPNEE